MKNQVPPSSDGIISYTDYEFEGSWFFSFEEFLNVIRGKVKPSAGGDDRITYDMIRALSDISKNTLLSTLNDSFLRCIIKESWRTIKIVPIPKRNRDLNQFENFRPISLISVMMKLINLMIKERMVVQLEN